MSVELSEVLNIFNQIGAVLLVIFILLLLVIQPEKKPEQVVIGKINEQLQMAKPYAFQPYKLHDYFVIEDESLGILVYAETEETLKLKLKDELISLWGGMMKLKTDSIVKTTFLKAVRQVSNEINISEYDLVFS